MKDMLTKIINQMNVFDPTEDLIISPFENSEDGEDYAVWLVASDKSTDKYVLKKAKTRELDIYRTYLANTKSAPRLLGSASLDGEDYILIEYIEGKTLQGMTREDVTAAIDALVSIQNEFWQTNEAEALPCFDEYLARRIDRGRYLYDSEIKAEYEKFIESFKSLPRTLCHDDLLPFNVIRAENGAIIIDWETAGILPYPTSLARLLAHTEESNDAFFYMTDADKEFAIRYYYDRLIESKGISYSEYKKDLDLFLLYEYCEWIMLGNKYPDADMNRYQSYLKKAKEHISTKF